MREDWIECTLDEVCEVLDNLRKPINSNERNERIKGKDISELYPYYGATGQVGYIDDYLTDGEYILLGEDAAPFLDFTKDVAYKITGKTWVNNHAHILKSHFNDDFLLHFLNQFQYRDFVTGTTRLKLTQGALKRMPAKLAPLPIQRAIVRKIEALFSDLDNGIANFKSAQEQ
jgi:type I restriction enzyme S subunit